MKLLSNIEMAKIARKYFRTNWMTATEVARYYKCSKSFVSAVQSGKKNPNEKMAKDMGLVKISGYVQVDIDS